MDFRHKLKDSAAHLALLAVGAVIMVSGCFQNSLWFDEAYTVGMMSHSVTEGMKWATFDVHPHLYYFVLKLFTLVFGNSLTVMRLFSAIGGILFVSLGFTHIRRDFGKKVGFWFSFCAIFSASTLVYALQIRMYTWAVYFVTLAAIYAFRTYRYPAVHSNRILFLVCSVAAAYIHHFALFAVCGINLVVLYYTVKSKCNIKHWVQNAAIQIGCYLPGAAVFIIQIFHGGASWITISWPDLVFDLVSYHVLGDTVAELYGHSSTAFFVVGAVFFVVYVAFAALLRRKMRSNDVDSEHKSAFSAAAKVYFGVILFALTVSLVRTIYYIRYTVVLGGLLFFMMALLIANFRKLLPKLLAAIVLIAVFCVQSARIYKTLYDPSADYVKDTLDVRLQSEDDFLFDTIDGFVISVQYPETETYFYNSGHWDIQKAYRAFGENTSIIDELELHEFDDRVWTLGRGSCYEYLTASGYAEVEAHYISTVYHWYNFELILLEMQ